jgi:3-phenylpropionate/trans-cinnamate dioxygenase ferredoxin reductase subunit
VAAHFLALHRASGADIRLGQSVTGAEPSGKRTRLLLGEEGAVEADAVIAAVGALANDDLAASAGLAVDRGIVVDELLLTSDPAVSAIGDCAVHPDPISGRPVRLESVQNAVDQGKTVAARLMGDAQPYRSLPWFWSTQGVAKLQIAGLAFGETTDVVRPSADPSRLSVFRFRDGDLLAVETVNQPGDHLLARRLLVKGAAVSREQAIDPEFNLKTLL